MSENVFKLKGKVLAFADGIATVTVTRRWRQGSSDDELILDLSKCSNMRTLKPGTFVEAVGDLKNSIDDPETRLIATDAQVVKQAGYENVARIVGKIYQNTAFPPRGDKPGYTNLLIEAGKSLFNATSFRGLGLNWSDYGMNGREVDFEGHIQRRAMISSETGDPLTDDEGKIRYSTEMICRDAARNKLKAISAAERKAREESMFSLSKSDGDSPAAPSSAPETAQAT